jgi:hypothetical protein
MWCDRSIRTRGGDERIAESEDWKVAAQILDDYRDKD